MTDADLGTGDRIVTAALDHTVGFLLKRAQLAVSRDIHHAFAEFDLTAVQFSALTLVRDNPGLPASALAVALEVERPRMVPVLDKLEQRRLIVRRPDPNDGRSRTVHLTRAGEKMLEQVADRFDRLEQEFATALGPDQRTHLLAALQALIDRPRPAVG